jgi:ankyrin repeat protein
MSMTHKISLQNIFDAYEFHPEFLGVSIEEVNQRGAFDSTLLHIASRTGNLDYIKTLIDAGADINAQGDLDNTPLHDAALCGQAQATELLLSLGANSTLKNEFGQTALDIAILGKKKMVCEMLRQKKCRTPFDSS